MNQEFKKKWIKALRSGNYIQGKGNLKRIVDGQPKYCCLGVACEIRGLQSYMVVYEVSFGPDHDTYYLPYDLQEELGIDRYGSLQFSFKGNDYTPGDSSLASANDAGCTFDQIADLIEYFF